MAVLETRLQNRIDALQEEANEHFESNRETYFRLLQQAWDLYPEPKENWNEAYSLAKEFFLVYLENNELESAGHWLHEMKKNNDTLQLSEGDFQFNEAKFLFETGDHAMAFQRFDEVVKDAGMRYFDEEDARYLEFYRSNKT